VAYPTPVKESPAAGAHLPGIRGVLFDLDGVLYVGSGLVEGAVEAVARVRAAGIPRRFITNTSTLSRNSLLARLYGLGFDVDPEELLTAPQATAAYLRTHFPGAPCHLLLEENVRRDFSEVTLADLEAADCIVVGDIGSSWTCELMDRIFNRLIHGARLICIHKNRFWQTCTGLRMDIGGYITALEYCSATQALVMGKPSVHFFGTALTELGLAPENVAIVGDDIDMDIGGGQAAGLRGVLVRTGKYRPAYAAASAVTPDRIIDSVRNLPALLGLPD